MPNKKISVCTPPTLNKQLTRYFLFFLIIVQNISCAQTKSLIDQPVLDSNNTIAPTIAQDFIAGSFSFFEVDVLNNIYLVGADISQLKKISSSKDSCCVFNDIKRYGLPSQMDVSNPMRPLVFYKDYATVVMLDRFLAQQNTINLRKKNIFAPTAVSNSYDNNIWVFDANEMRLMKLNDQGDKILESSDLRQITETSPMPNRILCDAQLVYLYDKEKGFFVFDNYGGFKNNIPLPNWENVNVLNGVVYGIENGVLKIYQPKTFQVQEKKLDANLQSSKSIKIVNGKIYSLTASGISITHIN